MSVPEDLSSTLSDHKIKNRVNQTKYYGFFKLDPQVKFRFSRNDFSLCCLSTSFLLQSAPASALSYCSLTAPAPRATYSRTVISRNQESSPPPPAFNRRQLLLSRSNREPAPMLKNPLLHHVHVSLAACSTALPSTGSRFLSMFQTGFHSESPLTCVSKL